MKIFAIDTSSLVASAALVDDIKTIAEFTINHKKTHSQTIMPMIDCIKNIAEIDFNSIDYIACSSGPGSFTGLRIGAAAAMGLAFSLNKKIVPVPTLDAIAYNIFSNQNIIVPIMDARRNQVYTAFYTWTNSNFRRLTDYMADDINIILQKLKSPEFNKNAIFLGDGVEVYKNIISDFDSNYLFAPSNLNSQKASSVAALAIDYAKSGLCVDSSEFKLMYLRKSQAEREFDERKNLK